MSKVRGGQVFVEIGADSKRFFKALSDVQKGIGKIGSSMRALGSRMAAIGAGIALPVGLAVRQFAAFDDAIRATAAVSQASGAELQKLNDKARELGATTSFTAIEVANLMTELGRAGFRPDEINNMTAAVLDLARATGTDAALSAGIMAATLRQFGMGATEATRAADVLTKTANSTFNTVESLGESLKYAGPVAKSLGLSLEDTAAILGVLGNVGIQGSEAGTALRRLGVISAASGDKLKQLFNVDNTDAAGNLKPLVQILDEINDATANMPVAERTKRMAEAFGLLGITSANVLSSTAGGVTALAGQLQNAEGTAAKAAKEMDAGLGGALRIALSAVEGTALAIGDALAPSLINAINLVEDFSTGLTKLVKNNQGVIVSAAKAVAGFAASGVGLIVLGKAVGLVSLALGGMIAVSTGVIGTLVAMTTGFFGLAFSTAGAIVSVAAYGAASVAAAMASGAAWAIANIPLLLLIGAVGGLVASMVQAYDAVGMVKSAASGLPNAITGAIKVFSDLGDIGKQAFGGIAEAIGRADIEGAIKIVMAGAKAAFLRGSEAIMSVVDGMMNGLEAAINDIMGRWEDFSAIFGRVGAFFGNTADQEAIDLIDKGLVAFGSKGRMRSQLGAESDRETRASERRSATAAAIADLAATIKGVNAPRMTPRAQPATAGGPLDVAAFDRRQAEEFTGRIANVKGMEELNQLTFDFNRLAEAGNLSDSQVNRFRDLVDAAAMGLDPTLAAAVGGGKVAQGDPAPAEVAGTFSSTNLSGMGFGQTLVQKLVDYSKRSAEAAEQMAGDLHGQLVAE